MPAICRPPFVVGCQVAVATSAQNPLLLCEQRLAGAALPCKSQTCCHPASRGSWGAWGIDNVRTDNVGNVGTGNVGKDDIGRDDMSNVGRHNVGRSDAGRDDVGRDDAGRDDAGNMSRDDVGNVAQMMWAEPKQGRC